ncbi:cyclin-G2 [Pimephales promelas]|uniref:cyclin-G2 n=1 Tax=Pimephales promelas TaxID=90988 RepID=UPI001955512D|nr:cyclin-G2 [Pimephales promelas]KAG1958589.1 cyclin-G1 isoform a [Pimephales promelas]KAG1958590.1 cyclin-G1 isoform a [Pimephales promelas]
MEAFKLMKELKSNLELEVHYLPKETGLGLIEASQENGNGVSAKCRDARVEDLWSLTSFFGYSTQTFVLAVNLLDRFLAMMKVQSKYLACISIGCLHIAVRATEEECNVSSSHELIRISQSKFTVSDLSRMEKIISEKLNFQFKAVTALTFLHLYHAIALSHTSNRKNILNLEKLEAQLKACLCRIVFSKAKPSVLALSLLMLEIEALQSADLLEIAHRVQTHLKISKADLAHWRGLVDQCIREYSSPECAKPDHKKLVWIVSRRTAQNLHSSYRSIPELPTIPEGAWDESESEDSSEDLSSGEESLSSSLGSDAEGLYFPSNFRSRTCRP